MNLKMNYQSGKLSRFRLVDTSAFFLVSVALSVYLVFRAILVPMAHDEIATFYYFVQSGKVSPFLCNIDTNNHFLNSLLTWIFYQFFGPSPLALRLANLLFIPVFFYFLSKIAQHLNSRIFRFAFFLTFAFTLHFIEFLALSRGYGMSIAMLFGSLFYLLESISVPKRRYYFYSLICIFIACLANLALINTYALILVFITITLIINNFKKIKSVLPLIFLAGILPISIVVIQILYIKVHAGLIAGSPDNFWATTISTLFAYLFETSDVHANIYAALLFSLIGITGILVCYKLKKIRLILTSKPFIFVYLFAGNIAIILMLGIFFHVNYPDDRIGLYLYPLAVGSLFFLLDHLLTSNKWAFAAAVPFLIVPIHFFIYMNTTYSIWYKYDVIPQRFYKEVMQNHKAGTAPPTLAGHGMRILCWSYLDYLHGGVASPVFFTHFPDYLADFQIVNLKMISGWQQYYDTIDYDPVSERHLLKIRMKHPSNTLISSRIEAIRKNNSEFIPIAEGLADTLRNKSLRVRLCFGLYSANKPFNSRIVFDVWDKNHKSLRYEYIQLNWLRNFWDGTAGNFNNCMLVYQVPPKASEYKIYIWNIDQKEVDLSEGYVLIDEINQEPELNLRQSTEEMNN